MRINASLAGIALLALSGCLGAKMAPDASNIGVEFSWNTLSCSDPVSPEIRLSNVPSGTKILRFSLDDLDNIKGMHGGGRVVYTGQNIIPKGALTEGYRGPCPPLGTHTYRLSVDALTEGGDIILGKGEMTRECCKIK